MSYLLIYCSYLVQMQAGETVKHVVMDSTDGQIKNRVMEKDLIFVLH